MFSMEDHQLCVKHKQGCGQRLFLCYPKLLHCLDHMLAAMVLSQHRISSIASSRTIRLRTPCHDQCRLWCMFLRRTWSAVCSMAPHTCNPVKEQDPMMHKQMESPNNSLQTNDLNPSCPKQAHFNILGTGHGYESAEPGCVSTVLRVPSVISPLGDTGLAYSIQLSSRPEIGQL